MESSALVIRIRLRSGQTCIPQTLQDHILHFSPWDLAVLTCCARLCALPLCLPVPACRRVLCRVTSVFPRRHGACWQACVVPRSLSLALFHAGSQHGVAALTERCEWFQLGQLVLGVWPPPTRVPMYPRCHLMIFMIQVGTVLLKSRIGGYFLHSLTLGAASASLPQLSRSSRPEFRSGRVWET